MNGDAATGHRHAGGENLEVMTEAENYNRYLRQLVRRFAGRPASALDFGAGIGTFSDCLDLPPGSVTCVEPDLTAREHLGRLGHPAFAGLDEVGDEVIDYVYTLNVLEHIEDDLATLREIYRVLKPGGRLFVYVPAFMLLFTSMDRHVGHCRRYRLSQLAGRLSAAGFVVGPKSYADALGFFATLGLRLFDSAEPAPLDPGLVRRYDRYLFPLSRLLSLPLGPVLGKNAWAVATKPAAAGVQAG